MRQSDVATERLQKSRLVKDNTLERWEARVVILQNEKLILRSEPVCEGVVRVKEVMESH